jgi:hypothetical protein
MSGFLEGAIVGGAIGGAIGGAMAVKQLLAARWHKKFLAALDDPDRAWAMVERGAPEQRRGKLPLSKLLVQRDRVIALALLDEAERLEAELARHEGGAAYQFNVQCFGLLGLALASDDPGSAVARLDALAGRIARDSNVAQKLLRDKSAQLARIAQTLRGAPLTDDAIVKMLHWVQRDHVLVRALVYRVLEVAAARAGRPNPMLRARVAELAPTLSPASA